MAIADVDAVMAIAAIVPTAPHWPSFEHLRMLDVIVAEPQRRGAWIAQLDDKVAGFTMASQVAGIAELEAVVTAPAFLRCGIGRALVQTAARWAAQSGAERLVLEVRASNTPALGLYGRLGFQQDGLRRCYYRNPDEDALLFSLTLAASAPTPSLADTHP
jgi:ribosomal-protein-alanine N-acetyltransferase